jgi:plasmid stability protein
MTDLLIRDIDPELKRRLERLARRHGRSLSEEAKLLLGRGLVEAKQERPLGMELLELFEPIRPIELEIPPRKPGRPPPDFE